MFILFIWSTNQYDLGDIKQDYYYLIYVYDSDTKLNFKTILFKNAITITAFMPIKLTSKERSYQFGSRQTMYVHLCVIILCLTEPRFDFKAAFSIIFFRHIKEFLSILPSLKKLRSLFKF